MESPEDDAGNATIASRRASAREKDIGLAEGFEPIRDTQHEPPEDSASCRTPAMSEDNFDGDSVPSPSPSPQDVNTSTEAILDMIDEFVDGPGAPKRLPLMAVTVKSPAVKEPLESISKTEPKQQTDDLEQPRTPSPAPIDQNEIIYESTPIKSEEYTPNIEDSMCANTSCNVSSPQTSSFSVNISESSNQLTECSTAVVSAEPESLAVQSVLDSPSSSIQSVQNISDTNECEQSEQSERTVKCVTSSDNRDNVTVERAESTSSECSVSESKAFLVEPLSRSPLKRRLVRPVPSDRRPDSTVSSTVDSRSANVRTTQPTSCDVVKDVSSSSDAVSLLHGKVKLEEISNVSEISICKAETSTAPKKIRLVRPKVISVLSNSIKTPEVLSPEKKQCQSTSPADDQASPIFPVEPSTSRVDIPKSKECEVMSAPVKCVMDNISTQVLETVSCVKISVSKENVISSNENLSPSFSTISPSESSTGQSKDLKSSDAEEAPSEIQSPSEPSKVKSKVESSEIQPNILEPKESTVSSKTQAITIPTEISKIQSKEVEPIEITVTSHDFECSKSVSKKTIPTEINLYKTEQCHVHSINLSELQSKVLEASHEQTKEYLQIDAQSKQSTSIQSYPEKLKPAQIQFKKTEEPTESLSKTEPKAIEIQSKLTVVKHEDKVVTEISSNVLEQIEVPSYVVESKESQSKLPELTENQSKRLDPAENPFNVLIPTESQTQAQEPAKVESNVLTQADNQPKVLKQGNSKPNLLKSSDNQPIILFPTESQTKELETADKKLTQSTEPKATEAQSESLDQTQNKSDVSQSKDLNLGLAKQEELDQSKITNIDSRISFLEIDTVSTNIKKKESLESGDVFPKKSLSIDVETEILKKQNFEAEVNALDEVRKLPPIKLTLTKVSKAEKKTNDTEVQSCSNNAIVTAYQDKQVLVSTTDETPNCDTLSQTDDDVSMEQKKVRPIKLNLSSVERGSSLQSSSQKSNTYEEKSDSTKHVPKLTIKLGNKQAEEMKSPIPKLTIKPVRPPMEQEDSFENSQQIPCVTKLNIKPIVKPRAETDSPADTDLKDQTSRTEKRPSITKLNIKPITKPAEKINDLHRKSSSSEISESEYSENDETSTSDQASASDQGPSDMVPKVTIKLGKPGTESEGKFYTEQNIPKLTIKGLQQNENDEKDVKLKLVISQTEDITMEKVPKLTIKTVSKSEGQPLSPKLTIKPIRPLENENEIPKLKITTDSFGTSSEIKESMHVPKITIKAVTKTDLDTNTKASKKSTSMCDIPEHIPVVTKLNIKPIMKPIESEESSEELVDKVPVVSKLNIKPIVKPIDNEVDSSVEDVPKIIKLNIKPLKNPEESSSEGKDCDENIVDMESIPVVTKLNIKPIVKPEDDERLKDSENLSSETGTSSDDNADHIPVVMKLNIKPILKPSEMEDVKKPMPNDQNIPVVTKLNIKPLVKPEDNSSPKRESLRSPGSSSIPSVAKLNIKPIVKHEETNENKIHDESLDKSIKKPPLVMKINMKNVCDNITDQKYNNYVDGTKSPRREITKPMSPKIKKSSLTPDRDNLKFIPAANVEQGKNMDFAPDSPSLISTVAHGSMTTHRNCLPEKNDFSCSKETKPLSIETKQVPDKCSSKTAFQLSEMHERKTDLVASPISPGSAKQKKSLQNCTLLKQLLSNTKDDSEKYREMSISNCLTHSEKTDTPLTNCNATTNVKTLVDEIRKHNSDLAAGLGRRSPISEVPNDLSFSPKSLKTRSIQDVRKDVNESITKPLEIVTDKIPNQSSGQDSPRIILKINKTDHGPSSKIITEECHKPKDSPPQNHTENTHQQEKQSPKKYVNSRKKLSTDEAVSLTIGKRLRSSKVVETPEKPAVTIRRNAGKRPVSETSPTTTTNKESEISVLDSKRLKLEQLLSVNKGLTITPVASNFTQTLQSKPHTEIKQGEKRNHSLLNNDNSKNGNSKLHNILSNLQAKQMQSLQLSEAAILNKDPILNPDAESNTSTGSSDVVVEISRIESSHPDVQEMIINENCEFRDIPTPEEISQDPLEVDVSKTPVELVNEPPSIQAVEVTPTPRKRGRPRKIPLSEGAKPAKPPTPPALPVSALEERPQRSLRLMRERPAVRAKPRGGRGRGRGGRRMASPVAASSPETDESTETVIVIETLDEDEPQRRSSPVRPSTPEDPTSSRIKLPRMTEALDKSSACMTPLSSRSKSTTDMKLFGEPAVVIESPVKIEEFMKSPEAKATRGRGSRGGRGTPRGRTPRGRGRGRGGGKGATYMKETMGIYGRVCGPATTTVELFEEETCMMDDNATPKPSHLLDEDSQSSVRSSTNDSSNKMKRSKFADLFDSNKVWTASDVKEYTWPPQDVPNVDHQVMMIQEQVAMFLGVKSFKRRYSELKRRAVVGEEKDYCLSQGIVTEALCDLGITAVDASDVLDIMLSDYPHKYEEYRSYQRQKQLTVSLEEADAKLDEKAVKIEVKSEKTSDKPEPPKVDPEKTRQDMAAAAIASAAEWNAMANAWRHVACADLQTNTIHRRRPPPGAAPTHCRPPHGFYPHAVLPGQYQHTYTRYTPEQLRYFPLNTVIAAPPAPPSPVESSSESEGSWGDSSTSSDDSQGPHHSAKRKKLTKVKRSSQQDKEKDESRGSTAPEEVVDLCRVCKLRLEANRKYTHERFLVCADCNAKLHPGCLELGADTIRKCREYAWQCGACKRCGACHQPRHDAMLHCDLCDRAFHKTCLGLDNLPTGRWHCVECAICKSCGARDPSGLAGALGTPGPSGTPGTSGTPGPSSTPGPSGTPGPAGPAEWHHQTRRGPGGHKVYSHSLCTPCARAYRIGRYCPLCERSFIGPKGTMQLVICKLCDRQLHQECVRATVSSLNVLDYRCAECRRGGITSRAGAVRAAPRTIATLFMAKRRFNKYAHKQYMQSRQRGRAPSDPEVSDPLDNTDTSRTDFAD